MRHYTFNITLHASFTLEAASEDEARNILAEFTDCAGCTLQTDNDDLFGEASFTESDVTLTEVTD